MKHRGTDIDSSDSYNAGKPSISFVAMITLAIESSANKMCQLSYIYKFISTKFPFYSISDKKWLNSIRHSLSFNDCFIRVAHRRVADKLKKSGYRGDYWCLHPDAVRMFEHGGHLRRPKKFVDDKKRLSNVSSQDLFDSHSLCSSIDTKESLTTSIESFEPQELQYEFYAVDVMTNGVEYYPPSYMNAVFNQPPPSRSSPYLESYTKFLNQTLESPDYVIEGLF